MVTDSATLLEKEEEEEKNKFNYIKKPSLHKAERVFYFTIVTVPI